jgi:hypothetical protein
MLSVIFKLVRRLGTQVRSILAVELYLLKVLVLALPELSPICKMSAALQLDLADEGMAFLICWPTFRRSPVGLILLDILVATKL